MIKIKKMIEKLNLWKSSRTFGKIYRGRDSGQGLGPGEFLAAWASPVIARRPVTWCPVKLHLLWRQVQWNVVLRLLLPLMDEGLMKG